MVGGMPMDFDMNDFLYRMFFLKPINTPKVYFFFSSDVLISSTKSISACEGDIGTKSILAC